MKIRLIKFAILLFITVFLFISCDTSFNGSNRNSSIENGTGTNTENTNNTVRVLLTAGPLIVTYSFINDEGDVYKQGTLMANETITINHFLKGTYHLQYKVGSYTQTFKVLSITNDCTVLFNHPFNITIN